MKTICVIDNHDSFVYNLVQLLREDGRTAIEIFSNDAIDFAAASRCSGVLLSPGPGIPCEAGDLLRLIELLSPHKPMLGVCLGHQALLQHMGCPIVNMPHPRHGHPSQLRLTDCPDSLLAGVPQGSIVGRYHSWTAEPSWFEGNADACITSLDEEGNVMSFRHTRLPLHGVQFHPESYITAAGRLMMRNWIDEVLSHEAR